MNRCGVISGRVGECVTAQANERGRTPTAEEREALMPAVEQVLRRQLTDPLMVGHDAIAPLVGHVARGTHHPHGRDLCKRTGDGRCWELTVSQHAVDLPRD